MSTLIQDWQARVRAGAPLRLQGNGTKAFCSEPSNAQVLSLSDYSGISSHEPTELFVTARCGTPLAEIEAALAAHGQCLAFEPPTFGGRATLGGMVAAGLSGPARLARGGVRDYVLGVELINGAGELMQFGGQVIKNVAGFDVSRLMCGSQGRLGIITQVSLKVLPSARASATLRFEQSEPEGISFVNRLLGQPLPIDASASWRGVLAIRLQGAHAAVDEAIAALSREGGELMPSAEAEHFWAGLREQSDTFFKRTEQNLWRLSVPATSPPLSLGESLIEWGGALRWVYSDTPLFDAAKAVGGHALLYRGQGIRQAPLDVVNARIQADIKRAFDPKNIFVG